MSADAGDAAVLIVVPTYNERDSLVPQLADVRGRQPAAHVLVVDDNSPDGTGELAEQLAQRDPNLHVLHRLLKQGLGAAYLAGFRWGIGRGFDVIVEMDADGSHRAADLAPLLAALEDADVVIGSRWVAGGSVRNWPRSRELLSRAGNGYTRLLLGVPVRDATAGFRAYRTEALERIDLRSVDSQGYCFQVDLTRRAVLAGLRVAEVPITFVDRVVGESKMSKAIVAEALWRVTAWGIKDRTTDLRDRLRARGGS